MNRALTQFYINIESVRSLDSIYLAFIDQVTSVIDLSEILRAEMIQIVSALDCYVHDMVRIRMLNIFDTNCPTSNSYNNFPITMECFSNIEKANYKSDKLYYLDQEIRRINGYKSFQDPDKISSALSLIGCSKMWDKLAAKMSDTSTNLRSKLTLIVDRRNSIAHESDIDPTLGLGVKYSINHEMIESTIGFIITLVNNIDIIVQEEI